MKLRQAPRLGFYPANTDTSRPQIESLAKVLGRYSWRQVFSSACSVMANLRFRGSCFRAQIVGGRALNVSDLASKWFKAAVGIAPNDMLPL